nr:MAG TPA: protein of unknown function (DUF3560) [Caudoviricetes sp.]
MDTYYYILNRETCKLELHFDKADYAALTDAQKQSIKGAFVWGRRSGCWISRCKEPNLWHAKQVAKALGLADAGATGERLSFAKQQERKAEKAERRAERLENAASRAETRGEALQKPITDMRGDVAFFTQPNINSSAGRAFTRQRDRMFAAYEAGFKEFNKSAYYRERAAIAHNTAAQKGLQDKGFCARRIKECESNLRKQKKNIDYYDVLKQKLERGKAIKRISGELLTLEVVELWKENELDRMEAELDKLGYYQDALDALGGVTYSQDNIKPGYVVKITRWGDCTVISTGPQNITVLPRRCALPLTAAYAEIENIVSAAEKADEPHPFKVGDTFTCSRWNREKGDVDVLEFRIIRATDKSVTIQTGDEKPFVRKPSRVACDNSGKWRLCITDSLDGTVYKLPSE